ncbi:MAG: PAAR domain-containing protein [Bryobacteraceae bacterium]
MVPPTSPTVLIEFLAAARVGDFCACSPPDPITTGSPTVIIENRPAVRIGDSTQHQGMITKGAPSVVIGDVGAGSPSPSQMAQASTAVASAPGQREAAAALAQAGSGESSIGGEALAEAAAEGTALVHICPG